MVKPGAAVKVVRRTKGQKGNKKKMATVGAVFSQAPHVRTPKAVLDSLSSNSFITDVRAEMARRDPEHALTWVMVTDGERALQRRVGRLFQGVTLVLDLLHVLEKLWKAAYVLHPERSP